MHYVLQSVSVDVDVSKFHVRAAKMIVFPRFLKRVPVVSICTGYTQLRQLVVIKVDT